MKLGKHQLHLLCALGNPFCQLIVSDKVSRSLVKRGLVAPQRAPERQKDGTMDEGSFFRVTPDGLRVLAEALDGGQVEPLMDPKFKPQGSPRLMIDTKGKSPK